MKPILAVSALSLAAVPAHTAEPATFLSELKITSKDGNPIRVPVEDWDGARRRTATDAQWGRWLEQTRKKVDGWMARHKDRAGWVAGWSHDFISPKDGSSLIWTEEVPGEEVQFLTSASDPKVEITPKIKASWIAAFRRRHLETGVEAAKLFRLTGETRYAEWAASQLDFYAQNYDKWPTTREGTAHLGWQSLDDATLTSQMIETARLLFNWSGATRRQVWFDKLFKPEVELLDRSFQSIHNIACWHRSVSTQIALVYGDEAMLKRELDGRFGLRAQIRQGVTDDYFWHEQSLGYNDYVVRATYPAFYMAGLMGRSDMLRDEATKVENLLLAPFVLRFSNGILPNPADTVGSRKVPSTQLPLMYRVFPTTIGSKAATEMRNWDSLLDPPQAVTATPWPEVKSRDLADTQFAVLKKGNWQLFLHYGQVNQSHSQSEALNWSATYKGTDITHDPGTVQYGSPLAGGYYRRGLNHNVPLVNGEGQVPWKRGKMLAFEAEAGKMTAAQPEYRPDATAERTLQINGEQVTDRTEVTYTGQEPAGAKLGLVLHLQGTPRLPASFEASADFTKDRPDSFKYWRDIRAAVFTDQAVIPVEFADGVTLNVRFSTPGKFVLYQGSSPDYASKHRAGFYLELVEPAKRAVFTTELTAVK